MNIEHLVSRFLTEGEISAALEERLRLPADRLAIYRLIVDQEPRQFRKLLLRLFDEEIAFRKQLWDGIATDDGEFSEGIFHCAFLIHCCGEPSDTANLWQAQHLNQDIGELDVKYFVGAGVAETLAFLGGTHGQAFKAIANYIESWLLYTSDDSIVKWRQGRRKWIEDA